MSGFSFLNYIRPGHDIILRKYMCQQHCIWSGIIALGPGVKNKVSLPVASAGAMNILQTNMTEDSVDVTPQSANKLSVSQTITFAGNDDYNCEDITAQNVVINSNVGDHDHGCSKVKFKNIVDYNWENKIYPGQLLAVHIDGKFLAYSLKAIYQPSPGKPAGMVRVAHRSTQKRALLKGMQGQVQDLSFAYIMAQVLLGCIDEQGNVFIHKLVLESDGIVPSLLLHIAIPAEIGSDHRILWCPYIPDIDDLDTDSEDDSSKLLLAIQGNRAYIWNVGLVTSRYGEGLFGLHEISECYLCIEDHTQPIVDAAFSPDGTSLATASCDGFVMFFQLYLNSDPPKCLYKWSPHDGKSLSCIFFLDNRNSTEQFWKYVVTGAEMNSVLKIWSCQTWGCLQTIIFAPHPKHSNIALKAGLDYSAKYLLLSDIYRRALFILHFDQNTDDSGAVYCKKITEFYLTQSILCFGIVDAKLKRLKCPSSCPDVYHQSNEYHSPSESPVEIKDENEENHFDNDALSNGHDGGIDNEDGCNISAVVRMYLIQPNRLQEGYITFSPIASGNRPSDKSMNISILNNDTLEYKDGLTDISQDGDASTLINTPEKDPQFIDNEEDISLSDAQQPLNTILVQQSQQLKNLLMRSQMAPSGFAKKPPSPLPPGTLSIGNMTFVPLIPLLPTSTSSQPQLNLMTPDAFSTAKHDEEDPPISGSPEVICLPPVPVLDSEMHLINNHIVAEPSPPITETIHALSNSARVFVGDQSQTIADSGKFASGGSSPSREVQEILSIKGSDCYYEDDFENEMNGQTPRNDREDSANEQILSPKSQQELLLKQALFGGTADGNLYKSLQLGHTYPPPPTKPPKINSSGFNEPSNPTIWPSINLAEINKANQRRSIDNSDKSSTHSKSNSVNLSAVVDVIENDMSNNSIHENNKQSNKLSYSPVQTSDMGPLISKLDQLSGFICDQQKEISVLKGELCSLRRVYQSVIDDNNSTVKIVEQSLIKNQVHLKQMVETAISSRVETDRANREALLSGVSQIVGVQMAEKLNAAVAHETRTTLIPLMERMLEPVARSLQLELSRKLTATDHLLTENIQKMVNNKSVMDNLCLAIAHSLTNSTKEAFKQTIQTSLIPHLEKAQSQMFKQLNQSFSSGTKEYLSAFDNCTKRTLENATTIDDSISKVKSVATQLQTALDHQNKNNTINSQTQQAIKQLNILTKELQSIIPNTLQGVLENQLSPIKECIREQITSGMAAQVVQLEDCVLSAVRSGAQTPAPTIVGVQAQQQHIESLLHNGQPNSAFQYALNASDLKLVVYTCTIADPRQVFCTPCPLQPNVLLSLIQQLSADMTSDTQLKCSYLGEAVMYLDRDNPLTKEHMPRVLRELHKQLQSFLVSNPQNPSTCQLKLLLLATESLLKLS